MRNHRLKEKQLYFLHEQVFNHYLILETNVNNQQTTRVQRYTSPPFTKKWCEFLPKEATELIWRVRLNYFKQFPRIKLNAISVKLAHTRTARARIFRRSWNHTLQHPPSKASIGQLIDFDQCGEPASNPPIQTGNRFRALSYNITSNI